MDNIQKIISHETKEILEHGNAIWLYQGAPSRAKPHALLTSGLHSNGYANVGDFIKQNPVKRIMLAGLMLFSLKQQHPFNFTHVVGADTSSTALAADIATISGATQIIMEKSASEKSRDGVTNKQTWIEYNTLLKSDDAILHIEELITTAGSASAVHEGIHFKYPFITKIHFVHYLPVIVDRSNPKKRVTHIGGLEVLPLLQLDIESYTADNCPYCQVGSEAIKPKESNNWQRLTTA